MAVYIIKKLNSSLAVTETMSSGTVIPGGTDSVAVRIAKGSGTAAVLVAYWRVTVVGSTTMPVCQFMYTANVVTAGTLTLTGLLPCWTEASVPVYNATTGKYYVHLHNIMKSMIGSADSIDYVSNADAVVNIPITAPVDYPICRPAAVLDNYTASADFSGDSTLHTHGYAHSNKASGYKPYAKSNGDMTFAHGNKLSAGLESAVNYYIDDAALADPSALSFATDVVSGGLAGYYDGRATQEVGFVNAPSLFGVEAAGAIAAGTYNWVVVFSYQGADGKTHYSRTSRPLTLTNASAKSFNIFVAAPTVTLRSDRIVASLYRTATGGTQYYLVNQFPMTRTSTSTVLAYTTTIYNDNMADAVLITRPLLYRQPGTAQTALDRYHGINSRHVVRHKDRVFFCNGNNVYYSSFAVDNEAPWFNPAFSFTVPEGQGPITGLATMDGLLIVFKRGAVFVVDGDGPPENGGNGTEFSPPRRIHTDQGCIDQRSITTTPKGIVYRSVLGIQLLTRNFQVEFIGERVAATVNANPYTGGATYDAENGRVIITLSNVLSGYVFNQDSAGAQVVYDTVNDAWTVWRSIKTSITGQAHVAGQTNSTTSIQDVCFAKDKDVAAAVSDNVYACRGSKLFVYDDSTGLDSDLAAQYTFPAAVVHTGWIRGASMNDRIRVTDFVINAQQQSGHNLVGAFYRNYNRATSTAIKTFDATATNIVPETLEFQPSIESVQSMKFALSTATPTNPTTVGTGRQLVLLGLSVRAGLKTGGVKLAAASKG